MVRWIDLNLAPGGFMAVCSHCGRIVRSEFDASMVGHYSDEPEMLAKIERQRGEPTRLTAEGLPEGLDPSPGDPTHRIYNGTHMSNGLAEPVSHSRCQDCAAKEVRKQAARRRVPYFEGMEDHDITMAVLRREQERKRKRREADRRRREAKRAAKGAPSLPGVPGVPSLPDVPGGEEGQG